MSVKKRPKFTQSLVFRTIGFNLAGFLLAVIIISFALDRYTKQSLLTRLDHELETEILVLTSEIAYTDGEITTDVLARQFQGFALAHGIAGSFFRAVDENGHELAGSDLTYWPGLRQRPVPHDFGPHLPFYWESAEIGDKSARLIYYRMPEGPILQVGYDLQDLKQQLREARLVFGFGMAGLLVIATFGVWLATLFSLKGIRQVTHAAVLISEEGTLDHRVPVPTGSSETDALALTFNQMLAYIQKLLGRLQEIMENVAHDLKTPVTRLRINAESRLTENDTEEDRLAGDVVEECDRILNLINTLLEITDVESGLVEWHLAGLDLAELLAEAQELFSPVAEVKDIKLKLEAGEPLVVVTDARAVQRVVANLIDNAVKFTPEGGLILLRLNRRDPWAEIEVIDNGIGMEEGVSAKVFDRFFREDRSRGLPGSGLGLSFCRAAVEGLGGEIYCESRLGQGTRFVVKLPLAKS